MLTVEYTVAVVITSTSVDVATVVVSVTVLSVEVTVVVVHVTGAARVVVEAASPMQEQALEYLTEPEQADAYVGIAVGAIVSGSVRVSRRATRTV